MSRSTFFPRVSFQFQSFLIACYTNITVFFFLWFRWTRKWTKHETLQFTNFLFTHSYIYAHKLFSFYGHRKSTVKHWIAVEKGENKRKIPNLLSKQKKMLNSVCGVKSQIKHTKKNIMNIHRTRKEEFQCKFFPLTSVFSMSVYMINHPILVSQSHHWYDCIQIIEGE